MRRVVVTGAGVLLLATGIVGTRSLVGLLAGVGAHDWAGIARDLGLTATRVIACLVLGLLWAVPLGIAIGRSLALTRWLTPLIQVAASFPAPMLFPLVAPLLHRAGVPDNATVVLLMALGTHWYVLFNVIAGAGAIPAELLEAAGSFRLPRWRRFLVVDLAGALPAVLTGAITAAGGAWNASVVAELVEGDGTRVAVDGIGARIARAFATGDRAGLAASTVALAFLLVLVHRLVWRPLQHLAATRFAVNQ